MLLSEVAPPPPPPAEQSRKWVFTLNNPLPGDLDQLKDEASYLVVGNEVAPTTGTPHLQGYVYLKKLKRRPGVSKLIPRAYVEHARGTHQQNKDYCTKGGQFEEFGVFPDLDAIQKLNGEKGKAYWTDVIRSMRASTVEEEYPEEFVKRHALCRTLAMEQVQSVPELDEFDNRWYYGEPGTGKSRRARDEFPGLFDKSINKWWDGYQNQDTVLLDDFDKNHAVLSHYVKRWSDRYPFPIEIKNAYQQPIRPKRIIITSNYTPEEIWPDDPKLCAAIRRRFLVERIGAEPVHPYFAECYAANRSPNPDY